MESNEHYTPGYWAERFPLMGFPNETNKPSGDILYQCWFGSARIALWKNPRTFLSDAVSYAVNIYHLRFTDETQTHCTDRLNQKQGPINVADAFEAQLAINYLVQKYLPTGVTNDVSDAYKEDPCPANFPSESGQAADVRSHACPSRQVG